MYIERKFCMSRKKVFEKDSMSKRKKMSFLFHFLDYQMKL